MTAPTPRHLRRLQGAKALVTGASGAFGGATAAVLEHLGADVVGIDRKPGTGVIGCDITDEGQVRQAVDQALDQFGGRLDLLINYAGVGPSADIGHMPAAPAHEALEVNLLGTWRVTSAALPALMRSRGRVVVTASLLAHLPLPLAGAYVVSKRAVTAYADMLRAEYGTHVGVTTVHPGYVDTPIHDSSRATGAALDGLVPAEQPRGTVMAVLRAAAARRTPRETASTPLGTAALHLTRHFPGITENTVALRMRSLLNGGTFADAEIAQGLHARHGTPAAQRNAFREESRT